MNTKELLHATGEVSVDIFSSDGLLKERIFIPNLVVQTGRNYIAARMVNTNDDVMSHMSVGTGNTGTDVSDVALESELARVSLDSSTVSTNTVTYQATYNPGTGTGAIVEAGIFNAGTNGTMLCRTVFDVVNKAADDTMVITWTITIS